MFSWLLKLKKEEVRTWWRSLRISSSKCWLRKFKAPIISTLLKCKATSKLTMMSWGLSHMEPNVWMIPRDLRLDTHQGNGKLAAQPRFTRIVISLIWTHVSEWNSTNWGNSNATRRKTEKLNFQAMEHAILLTIKLLQGFLEISCSVTRFSDCFVCEDGMEIWLSS
jgi:hypothetical protein